MIQKGSLVKVRENIDLSDRGRYSWIQNGSKGFVEDCAGEHSTLLLPAGHCRFHGISLVSGEDIGVQTVETIDLEEDSSPELAKAYALNRDHHANHAKFEEAAKKRWEQHVANIAAKYSIDPEVAKKVAAEIQSFFSPENHNSLMKEVFPEEEQKSV